MENQNGGWRMEDGGRRMEGGHGGSGIEDRLKKLENKMNK